MKITGASRRSAAPGSQSVGVAEYGAVLCRPSIRTTSPQSGVPPTGIHKPCLTGVRLALIALHQPLPRPSNLALQFAPLPSVAALPFALSFGRQSRSFAQFVQQSQAAAAASARSLNQMLLVPKTEANPSFNLTRSGLRPPRAS
jgi:hypothetical protein